MRQWRWRIFGFSAVVSSLVLLAAGGACIRGHRFTDQYAFVAGPRFFLLMGNPSEVSLMWLADMPAASMPPSTSLGWTSNPATIDQQRGRELQVNVPEQTLRTDRFAGVVVSSGSGQLLQPARWFPAYRASPLVPYRGIAVRWGTLIASAALLPVLWLAIRIPRMLDRRRRIRLGLCADCAYDLRGSPSERCPECGARIARYKSPTLARATQP
jgi:hypothetical protein